MDTTSDGYAPVPDYTRQATTSTGEPAVFKQVPAPGSLVLPGLRSIMLTGTLASGESAVTGFQLQVIDRTPPVIAAPSTGFTSLTLESNAAIPDYASQAVVTDNVAVTSRTQSPAAGTLATVGTFPVTITATDAKGNTTSASINVTVKPPADVPNEVQYVSYVATNAAADASGAPTGSTFTTFGVPSINDDGAMAYRAGLKRGTVTSTGLFCGNPAALVASVGDAAPGVDGAVFASFYDPCLNHGRGIQPAVAFLATIKAATGKTAIPTAFNTGLWTNLGGTVQLIARAGDGAPGCTGGLFKSITSVTFVENEVVFTATLSGAVTTANDAGSWAWNATTGLRCLLMEGQPVTCAFGGKKTVGSFQMLSTVAGTAGHGRHHLGAGMCAARVTCTDRTVINYVMEDADGETVLTALAQTGSALLPGLTSNAIGSPVGNCRGELAFVQGFATAKNGATTAANNLAVMTDRSGAWEVVARKGDVVGESGVLWSSFNDPVLNDERDVAWIGTLSGTPTALNTAIAWNQPASGTQIVARKGYSAPGVEGGVFDTFTSMALPDGGVGPVFTATLLAKTNGVSPGPGGVTAMNDSGLWAVDSTGAARLLLREGQTLAGRTVLRFTALATIAGSPGQTRSFNAHRTIVASLGFSDRTEAIVQIKVP